MSVQNEQIIPVQVKYVEVQSATVLRNEKIPSSSTCVKTQQSRGENCEAKLLQNGLCQSPVAAENIDMTHGSPVVSPGAGSPTNPLIPNKFQFDPNLTYAEKVAHEMIVTEKIYLDNLKQIIDGFLGPVTNDADLDISQESIDDLFINVEEIYRFNWILLQDMERCNFDPVKLAECFVLKQIGFDIYTKYCTHYPRSMEVLLEWNQREDTANFIKRQQESLGHTLPLCSFLLKPVQRILKYHLLLGNIAKHFKQAEDEDGFEIIQKALSAMTSVAKHINDMKRKHEDAVHLQEIESVLLDYEGPNLTSFGSIVLEDTFRIHGTKTGRYLLLFEKALLITKRRSDGTFSWKATVMYSNMMLADSVFREPLTFQVIPFDDRKICYTFVSRDLDTKQIWLLELKRRLLDSYAAAVPMKAKQIILGNGKEDCEKENAEPDSPVRRSTSSNNRKGANQQRAYSNKDSPGQSAKLSKNSDSDRRKSKDPDETAEEKTKTPIDSIKSPLRRKLRVFTKKRKFTKEPGKSSKRVSWSSDDNNDESFTDKERLSVNKEEDQETKVSDSEPNDANADVRQNDSGETKYLDNNDNVVSISSLLRDGTTMVSVTGEEDNHLSGHVKDIPALKKRRLTREKRQKCKSMPVGEFSNINEDESTIVRTHSTSKLYEKFLESELLDSPTSVKELQKYGLVNLREHPARTKRLGSYDETTSVEGTVIHRSSDMCDVADDVIAKSGQSVHQTMKRVSAAFSDISPTFSPDKSPSTSTEELVTNDDITAGDLTTEDFTPGDLTPEEYTPEDLTPDEYTPGDLTPEDDTPGDLSPEDSVTESSIPDELFTEEIPQSNTEDGASEAYENGQESECDKEDTDKNMDSELEYSEHIKKGVNTNWNQTETADNEDSEVQSQDNRHRAFHSEPSSYAETLSDSFDEIDDDSWPNIFDGSYQRVFSLKRSYSEENLVSKTLEGFPSEVASKSYTHMNHAPVTRSKSAGACSQRPQSLTRPFTFSVTPKKKIVIKDSLWETIKEDVEINRHEMSVAKDVHTLRRRQKKKSGHKKNKKNKNHTASIQHLVRTCASLNMADYRPARNDARLTPSPANPLEGGLSKTKDYCEDTAGSPDETNNNYDTIGPYISEGNNRDTAKSHSSEDANYNTAKSNKSGKTEDSNEHPPPVTTIAVALRKKNAKPARDRSLVRVDRNVSEVPSTINYLCIEAVPSDESPSSEELAENYTRDVTQTNGDTETCTRDVRQTNGDTETCTRVIKRTNGNTASKVERLSKYFNEAKMENNETSNKYNKQAENPRNGRSIKKRLEELSQREMDSQKSKKNSEEKLIVKEELNSLQNIQDRIGVLRRSTSDENQTTKTKIELTSSLNHGIPNVQQIRNRLEESSATESGHDEIVRKNSNENGISKKSTSLRIKDRIEELTQYPASNGSARAKGDKKPDKNVDDELRSCKRLKERIEKLQKGAKREVSERDITISDDKDTSELLSSPRENEELRTVVIKRGWVQQFIQKIETGS